LGSWAIIFFEENFDFLEKVMNNKTAIATILGTALLGLAKVNTGSRNEGVTIKNMEDLIRYSQDPELAKTVTKVDLRCSRLTRLPAPIGNLVNLKFLNLSGNNLPILSESIGNLVNLEELYLAGNNLSIVPESIGNLVNLESLYLTGNDLTSLPESIGNLVNLEFLNLYENNLTSIPDSIGNLVNLVNLELDGNNLSSLPESIGNLVSLELLDLSGNPLSGLSRTSLMNKVRRGFSPNVAGLIMRYLSDSPRNKIRSF
jgi:Leucine-rich repeat (LRR) protein